MSGFMYCATARGVEEHIRDAESCRVCKEWVKAGRPVTPPAGVKPAGVKPAPVKKKRRVTRTSTRRSEVQCGTNGGFQRHYRQGEEACEPCKEAKREYNRGYRPKNTTPRELKPCGTRAAYQRHKLAGEEPCEACKIGNREDSRRRQERQRRDAGIEPHVKPREHGTRRGYRQHKKYGEPVCAECLDEYNRLQREYRQTVRERRTAG